MFVLTEKPSVAEAFASALNFHKKTPGLYVSENEKDCIVAAGGHVLELFEPEDYDSSLKKWKLEDLPIIPDRFKYKPITEKKSILARIKKAFEQYDSSNFILATDAEREGQYIGELILDYVNFKHRVSAKRFWVSSALSKETILNGIKTAKPLSDYMSYRKEGEARSKADWLLGMNISRLLTCSTHTLLTFGRVQTAVLGAVYVRDRNIAQFKPEPYFQLQLETKTSKDEIVSLMFYSDTDSPNFKEEGRLIGIQATIPQGVKLTISEVEHENKKELPPQLFNLTGLQKHCASNFHFSAKKTLECAQKLYELGFLSYPRTPSTVMGDEDVDFFLNLYNKLKHAYSSFAHGCDITHIASSNKRIFNSKNLSDHHALVPLEILPADTPKDLSLVYNAIAERFFTSIKKPHEYLLTKIDASYNQLHFKTSGKTVISEGWKTKKTEEDLPQLPHLQKGDNLTVQNSQILKKFTVPKKHFTEASLLALMENPKNEEEEHSGKLVGLGTPATRADIIASLIQRQYISQSKQNLLITPLGKFLIETVIQAPQLADLITIGTTTKWEEMLSSNPENFLTEIEKYAKETLPLVSINAKWEKQSLGICPICKNGSVIEGKKSYYCSLYKQTGCTFTIWNSYCGANITDADILQLIQGRTTAKKKMKSKTGNQFSARLKFENGKIIPVFENKSK